MNTEEKVTYNNVKVQKYLGDKGFIVFIAFLGAFVPLSTDLYLPALPSMVESFHTNIALLNLTLIFFFIFYAGGMLVWGPLSDKYGRKPILLSGLIIYTLASILCSNAGTVYQLIVFRILQAIGSGAAVSVSVAMIKDSYDGRKRVSILALVQSMAMLAPVIAPVLGALVLKVVSWHGVFWILSIVGIIGMAGGFFMQETIVKRNNGNIFQTIGRIGVVIKNPSFAVLLVTFSIQMIPLMAYISMSSYIYVDGFGLSEQVYSYFYAFNAIFSVIAPLFYMKLSRHYKNNLIITTCFSVVIISGILIITIGRISPWLFALSILPATLAGNLIRPPSTNLILEQQHEDTGTATSLMSFSYTFMGTIGMMLISLNFGNRIFVMGSMYAIIAVISLVIWIFINKTSSINNI
ncbi:multidrug effflux MFS transporter [Clostridium sp.]|jgi:DHA1 family bicyclomycin/chloramphenicol resistance-like MFS transporter|uniref:multidrug effflux MFS transporter n=1 Tax=Clostridium sp. TaxID=1506 RepID=UPI00258F4C98|nr:multidrug effflux MFS transporter [Clostridium sp.]MDF2504349.1 drug resistance transporter, Bcr/CflA subfamily [Clostridium sp.]